MTVTTYYAKSKTTFPVQKDTDGVTFHAVLRYATCGDTKNLWVCGSLAAVVDTLRKASKHSEGAATSLAAIVALGLGTAHERAGALDTLLEGTAPIRRSVYADALKGLPVKETP